MSTYIKVDQNQAGIFGKLEKFARNYFRIDRHEGVFGVAHSDQIFPFRLQVYFQSLLKGELNGSFPRLNYVNWNDKNVKRTELSVDIYRVSPKKGIRVLGTS